jgi:hypothetical protein
METILHDRPETELRHRLSIVEDALFSWKLENQSHLSARDREKIEKLRVELEGLIEELKRREGES